MLTYTKVLSPSEPFIAVSPLASNKALESDTWKVGCSENTLRVHSFNQR